MISEIREEKRRKGKEKKREEEGEAPYERDLQSLKRRVLLS